MIFGAGSGIGVRIPAACLLSVLAAGCASGGLRDGRYEGVGTPPPGDDPAISRTLAKVSVDVRGNRFEAVLGGIPHRGRVVGAYLEATEKLNRPVNPPEVLGRIIELKAGPVWRPNSPGRDVPLTVQPLPAR